MIMVDQIMTKIFDSESLKKLTSHFISTIFTILDAITDNCRIDAMNEHITYFTTIDWNSSWFTRLCALNKKKESFKQHFNKDIGCCTKYTRNAAGVSGKHIKAMGLNTG